MSVKSLPDPVAAGRTALRGLPGALDIDVILGLAGRHADLVLAESRTEQPHPLVEPGLLDAGDVFAEFGSPLWLAHDGAVEVVPDPGQLARCCG